MPRLLELIQRTGGPFQEFLIDEEREAASRSGPLDVAIPTMHFVGHGFYVRT